MQLSHSSIEKIKNMLQERVQILNIPVQRILNLNTEQNSMQSFPNQYFDLILFYLDAAQLEPLSHTLKELKRLLQVQGVLLFACTGIDMHDLGDALLKAGFSDPVTDRECFEIEVNFAYAWRKPETTYQLDNGDIAIPINQISTKTKA
jgi:hypothetical protein